MLRKLYNINDSTIVIDDSQENIYLDTGEWYRTPSEARTMNDAIYRKLMEEDLADTGMHDAPPAKKITMKKPAPKRKASS